MLNLKHAMDGIPISERESGSCVSNCMTRSMSQEEIEKYGAPTFQKSKRIGWNKGSRERAERGRANKKKVG